MEKNIKVFGIIPISLLLIALIMSILHLPNHAIFIVLGIIIFSIIELPIFFVLQNRKNKINKAYNIFTFLSLFLFILSLFFALQHFIVPVKISIVLSVLTGVFLLYFFITEIKNKRIQVNKVAFIHFFIVFIILLVINVPIQLQAPDYTFNPEINKPSYTKNEGPLIYVDEGHNNFHALEDRLFATGKLLEKDGYKVQIYEGTIIKERLKECKIFFVVNALNEKNEDWINPIYSAFTHQEIMEITQWVTEGGSLFIIADHMPFPGAIHDLAVKFGFEFENGHAKNTVGNADYFYRKSKSLITNAITNGKNTNEEVDSILTFSGSAFKIPDDATSILTFDSTWISYNPKEAWNFTNITPFSIQNYSQGAYKSFGEGRVVIFGEAMMFTAQLGAGLSFVKIGMNSDECHDNYQLLLNTIHWLDRQMD